MGFIEDVDPKQTFSSIEILVSSSAPRERKYVNGYLIGVEKHEAPVSGWVVRNCILRDGV